jgi:hypothetical protein
VDAPSAPATEKKKAPPAPAAEKKKAPPPSSTKATFIASDPKRLPRPLQAKGSDPKRRCLKISAAEKLGRKNSPGSVLRSEAFKLDDDEYCLSRYYVQV